jgi:hypothetical protein
MEPAQQSEMAQAKELLDLHFVYRTKHLDSIA